MKVFIALSLMVALAAAADYKPSYKPKYSSYEPKYSSYEPKYPSYEPKYSSYEPKYPEPKYPSYEPKYPSYEPKSYYPKSESYDYPPMPYKFDYNVKDEYYNDYAHEEYSDAKGAVQGSYRTYLPDGRVQTVNYKDEGYGFIADVSYEGYAKYPEYKPSYKKDYEPAYPKKDYYEPSYPKKEHKYDSYPKYPKY